MENLYPFNVPDGDTFEGYGLNGLVFGLRVFASCGAVARYGTFIVDSRVRRRSLPQADFDRLCLTDVVWFLRGNAFAMSEFPVLVCPTIAQDSCSSSVVPVFIPFSSWPEEFCRLFLLVRGQVTRLSIVTRHGLVFTIKQYGLRHFYRGEGHGRRAPGHRYWSLLRVGSGCGVIVLFDSAPVHRARLWVALKGSAFGASDLCISGVRRRQGVPIAYAGWYSVVKAYIFRDGPVDVAVRFRHVLLVGDPGFEDALCTVTRPGPSVFGLFKFVTRYRFCVERF